ncbi:unnamed protein product [Rotaria socialis]|uniref:Uncharacterized protein n=1 Tax=Rotaria socialis TaxID=392032 RepID=A0A820W4C8_9BILA|nr:unnamed protein product [Rotaria socialis]
MKNEYRIFCNYAYRILFSVISLHYKGHFYNISSNLPRYDTYLPCDIEDYDENDKSPKVSLDLGDFTIFNFMPFSIMHPAYSIITKIFVTLECIVFIQVDYNIKRLIARMWHLRGIPDLPCPVVFF